MLQKNVFKVVTGLALALGVSSNSLASGDEDHVLESKILGEERHFQVSVPDDYPASGQSYPLILILDGQKHFDHARATTVFLERAGEVPEHIIVGLTSTDRLRDFSPSDSPDWEGADGGGPKFLDFLRDEFLVHLHTRFRISSNRVLAGHSASGLLTAFALAEDPTLFEAYFALDGSLDWDGKVVEKMLGERFKKPFPQQRFFYFDSSFQLGQDLERNVFRSLEALLLEAAPSRLRWVYEAEQTETHASVALIGYQRALRRLYDGWWVPEATMAKGLSAVEEHYRLRRGWVGARQSTPLDAILETGFLNLGLNPTESLRAFEAALPQLEKQQHPDLDEVKNLILQLKED